MCSVGWCSLPAGNTGLESIIVVARRAFRMLPFLLLLPPIAAIAADEEADFGPAPAMEALLKLDMVYSFCLVSVSVRDYGLIMVLVVKYGVMLLLTLLVLEVLVWCW